MFVIFGKSFFGDNSMLNTALLLSGRSKGTQIQLYSAVQNFGFASWLRFFSINANSFSTLIV